MVKHGAVIFLNMLDGLAELKKLKILHRNITPDSIMVSDTFLDLEFCDL